MSTPFNQGAPTVPVVLNTSNCFVFGNTASGNAMSVQQLGTGNVASFRTATGATSVFIDSTGNTGFGTTTPVRLIHGYAAAGSNEFRLQSSAVTIGMGINAGNNFGFVYNRTSNPLVFGTNDAERMRITETGNVGIGTASPGNKFQVGASVDVIYANNPLLQSNVIVFGNSPSKPTTTGTSTIGGTLFVNSTNDNASNVGASIALGGRGFDFGGGQQHMTFARIQGTQSVGSSAYYGDFVIETQNSGALYERMRINQDGRVGIGNTAPLNTLHVGTTGNGGGILVTGDSNTLLNLQAINSTVLGAGVVRRSTVSMKAADTSDKALQFFNNSTDLTGSTDTAYKFLNNTASATSMSILNNGNVGIGSTTPSTKLSVEGLATNTGRNDVGMTLNVNVNDAALSTTALNAAPFAINVLQTQSGNYRFCQFNSNYTPNNPVGVDAEFIVYGNGNVTADGTYTSPADYAEMFEWEDGNPDNEDRVGYSVVLSSGNKIRKSESTDPPESLIGVVSGRPAVCADTAWNRWADKYLKDDFNRYLKEEYEVWKWTDESGNEISYAFDQVPQGIVVPHDKTVIVQDRYVLNPNYDPDVVYTPRMERKEWSPIGMVGKLSLRTGQLTGPRWIKLVDFSPTVSQWLIR